MGDNAGDSSPEQRGRDKGTQRAGQKTRSTFRDQGGNLKQEVVPILELPL